MIDQPVKAFSISSPPHHTRKSANCCKWVLVTNKCSSFIHPTSTYYEFQLTPPPTPFLLSFTWLAPGCLWQELPPPSMMPCLIFLSNPFLIDMDFLSEHADWNLWSHSKWLEKIFLAENKETCYINLNFQKTKTVFYLLGL
jgi:hypothetical protein